MSTYITPRQCPRPGCSELRWKVGFKVMRQCMVHYRLWYAWNKAVANGDHTHWPKDWDQRAP